MAINIDIRDRVVQSIAVQVQGLRVPEIRPRQGYRYGLISSLVRRHKPAHRSVWRGQIQTVKSKKGNRRFPISPELGEHLRGYLGGWKSNPLGLLFATQGGTPWDHSLVRKRKFHRLLKKLGIPQCGFHAFRHGNATLLDQIGAPMAVRQNRLGHADAQTPMDYTHAVTADERRIAVELGKILHVTARSEQGKGPATETLTPMIQ